MLHIMDAELIEETTYSTKVISPLTVLEKLKGARLPSLTWPDACGLYMENK